MRSRVPPWRFLSLWLLLAGRAAGQLCSDEGEFYDVECVGDCGGFPSSVPTSFANGYGAGPGGGNSGCDNSWNYSYCCSCESGYANDGAGNCVLCPSGMRRNRSVDAACVPTGVPTGTFCQGDIMSCGLAFTTGFVWLLAVCGLAAFAVIDESIFAATFWLDETGKARGAKVWAIMMLFLVPKVCVAGISLAHAKTEEFSAVYWYPILGFLVVTSTLAVASACVLLRDLRVKKARGLLAILVVVLHTVLSLSVLVYVAIAAKFPSQRELCVLHCCVDLAQLFGVQLVATYLGDSSPLPSQPAQCNEGEAEAGGAERWRRLSQSLSTWFYTKSQRRALAVAGFLLYDSWNIIYMALLGMWAWMPGPEISEGAGLAVYRTAFVVWIARQAFFGVLVFKSVKMGGDTPGSCKRAIPAVHGFTSATLVTVTLLSSPARAPLPGGYFPMCVILVFLPHMHVSRIQVAHVGLLSVGCWFDLASAVFILAHMWISACVVVADYYRNPDGHTKSFLVRTQTTREVDVADDHVLALLPVLVHALFVVGNLSRDDSATAIVFGTVIILTDWLYCMIKGWMIMKDAPEQSTTLAKWIFQWMSLFTTGLALLCSSSGLSVFGTVAGIVILTGGGLLLVLASSLGMGSSKLWPLKRLVDPQPRNSEPTTAAQSSKLAAAFALLVDGVPVVYFIATIASTTFDTSLEQATTENVTETMTTFTAVHMSHGSGLLFFLMLVFMYKTVVWLWYSVFELHANWKNDSQLSWVPVHALYKISSLCGIAYSKSRNEIYESFDIAKNTLVFVAAWSPLCLHCFLTLASAKAGLNTLGSVPTNGNHCVGTAHPDAWFTSAFRCASPTDMLAVDIVFFFGAATMFMLFAGEAVNKTKGDMNARWVDSSTAKVAENALQMILTGQVLYSMLRLRTQSDPLHVLFCILDLAWIFLMMLSRQLREGYNADPKDWGPMYLLEAWDVVNSLIVTVTIARDTEHDWPTWVADLYVVFTVLTLLLFEVTYPFWTSLKRIAWISCFNDFVTDGPMLTLMIAYELYDKSTTTAIAAFVNICIIAVGVFIWPLKWYIKEVMDVVEEGVPPGGGQNERGI